MAADPAFPTLGDRKIKTGSKSYLNHPFLLLRPFSRVFPPLSRRFLSAKNTSRDRETFRLPSLVPEIYRFVYDLWPSLARRL
jgi:hypothetical protein